MIKLETKMEKGSVFYFKTINDCKKFMYVFENHWCNIDWEEPEEVPDDVNMSYYQRKLLDKDPKDRAESNLNWGFQLLRYLHKDQLTQEQSLFVSNLINKITKK